MRLRVEDVQGRNCLTNFWVSVAHALLSSVMQYLGQGAMASVFQ
jgi:hypothetical protein